jgi:hypothetical protein
MPILSDPREFITSVSLACGYRSDVECTPARWGNFIDPDTVPLVQPSAFFQPAATVEAEIRQPALQFTDDVMTTPLGFGLPSFPTTKSRYLRMIVRLDAHVGNDRTLFSAGVTSIIKTGSAPGELKLKSTGVNTITIPLATFRRLDAVLSVAASDTWLRFGSIITTGGVATVPNDPAPSFGGFSICGGGSRPNITVAAAWVTRGRPTDRELTSWDACDAARYGAGALA